VQLICRFLYSALEIVSRDKENGTIQDILDCSLLLPKELKRGTTEVNS
jgi:hypothetical protein